MTGMCTTADIAWFDLPSHQDDRGRLTAIEAGRDVPIDVKRVFFVHETTRDRGGHAHRDTDQVLIAVCGALTARAFDGMSWREFRLDDATRGLFIPRMLFVELVDFSASGVCLVLANTHYDRSASIRSQADYITAIAATETHRSCQ